MIDLTGKRFVRLVVIGKASERAASGRLLWICKCDCGNSVPVDSSDLRRGKMLTCGSCPRRLTTKEQLLRKTLLREPLKRQPAQPRPKAKRDRRLLIKVNLKGEKFGLLTVKRLERRDEHRKAYWRCECRCRRIRIVRGERLRDGMALSCGSRGCKGKIL